MKIVNALTLSDLCQYMLDGEPVFLIRAQDKLAIKVVAAYADEAFTAKAKNLGRVSTALQEIRDWQAAHPQRVKVPD